MFGRFPRAWGRGLGSGALGGLRRRILGEGSGGHRARRFHQLTNSSAARPKGPISSVGREQLHAEKVSLLRRGLESYNRMNDAHPTVTKVGTSVVILIFGDVSAQKIQHNAALAARGPPAGRDRADRDPFVLDLRRLVAFASFGAIYTGWFQMHWFRILQGWFPRRAVPAAASAAAAAAEKTPRFFRSDVLGPLLVNQFGAVPMAYYPFYFVWTGFVRGQSRDEILDAARAKYKLRLLAQNWAFWLPAQAAQFAVVPSGYHILYVSAMGLAWNTILSLTTLTSADASGEGARRENSAKKIVEGVGNGAREGKERGRGKGGKDGVVER